MHGSSSGPLDLLVEPTSACQCQTLLTSPSALALELEYTDQRVAVNALSHETGVVHLTLPSVCRRQPPTLRLCCPIPLTYRYTAPAQSTPSPDAAVEAATVERQVNEWLANIADRPWCEITLDAGTFGRIFLRLEWEPAREPARLDPALVRRARWLAAVLPTFRNSQAQQIRLPETLRSALRQLAQIPGCAALAQVSQVPILLMPQVRAIAHASSHRLR